MSNCSTDRHRATFAVETLAPPLEPAPAPLVLRKQAPRSFNRQANDMRPLSVKTGAVTQANGSALLELGDTKVLCAVHGPRGTSSQHLFSESALLVCHVKYTTFASKRCRRDFVQDDDERHLSATVQHALSAAVRLDAYPKAIIDVSLLILQDGGSALAACVSAASVALASAGIEMFDIVTCASVAVLPDDALLIDPDDDEEHALIPLAAASVTVAMMPRARAITLLSASGELPYERLVEASEACMDACTAVEKSVKSALLEHE